MYTAWNHVSENALKKQAISRSEVIRDTRLIGYYSTGRL